MDRKIMKEGEYFFNEGRFNADWESLQQYGCPDWFRDAKFGIWSHWGPQSVPMQGDWYARQMYMEGQKQYEYHVKHYGHPSQFGYKDIIDLWKAEKFDPAGLMKLFKKAGARYFAAQAGHHDNFDNWDSVYQKRWNSVARGPKRDICREWKEAAQAEGLRFGLTEHIERAWCWFNTNKGADSKGPYKDVPYDGHDPKFRDLYFADHGENHLDYPKNPPAWWVWNWYARVYDAVEQLDPDLLYTDGAVPFGETGLKMIANYYNANMKNRGGSLEAVYNYKDPGQYKVAYSLGEFEPGAGVLDREHGSLDEINPEPWQTDTCLGDWFYREGVTYQSSGWLIKTLIDIVSKNGNLLLNVPQKPDGTIDDECRRVLEETALWTDRNGEALYGTRPWDVYGEGNASGQGAHIHEKSGGYGPEDIRFTRKGSVLYAHILAPSPDGVVRIKSLGQGSGLTIPGGRIESVRLLGCDRALDFKQAQGELTVPLPKNLPDELREQQVSVLKIS